MLNCGDMISTIDQGLVFSIQEATLAAGVSKYNMEELMLTTVYDNTSPYRNFTPRDSLSRWRLGEGGINCEEYWGGNNQTLTIYQKDVGAGSTRANERICFSDVEGSLCRDVCSWPLYFLSMRHPYTGVKGF